jgi:hypothetical protein
MDTSFAGEPVKEVSCSRILVESARALKLKNVLADSRPQRY